MATTLTHFRFGWGLIDAEYGSTQTPAYAPAQIQLIGDSAAPGSGVGVRRATLELERSATTVADDNVTMHFDFLNITDGSADDTWTAADFSALESRLLTWFGAVKVVIPTWDKLQRISWHRVGTGVVPPNPAERLADISPHVAGTADTTVPPQCAVSISLRTAIRKHWGRTYVPLGGPVVATGRFSTTSADALVAATVALAQGAKTDDFIMVVTSSTINSALTVDSVACDDVIDTIRRRRWKHQNYRKLTNV